MKKIVPMWILAAITLVGCPMATDGSITNNAPNPPGDPPDVLNTVLIDGFFDLFFTAMPVDPDGDSVKLVVGETAYLLDLADPDYPVTGTPAPAGLLVETDPRFDPSNDLRFMIDGIPTGSIYDEKAIGIEVYSEDDRGLRSDTPVIIKLYLFGPGAT